MKVYLKVFLHSNHRDYTGWRLHELGLPDPGPLSEKAAKVFNEIHSMNLQVLFYSIHGTTQALKILDPDVVSLAQKA